MKIKKRRLSSPQIMVLGFLALVFLGALVLMLPVASAKGEWTNFVDALFTSTTSVCVTGLVTVDTGTHWSMFGQSVILVLIQIGGLGVVTLAACFMMAAGRKIGLMQRSTMQDAVSAHKLDGIVRLTGFIVKGTLLIELTGAAIMAPTFIGEFGWGRGIWFSIFHSISAFCNAGIDLMGCHEPFSSLTYYADNIAINVAVILLVVVGGIGFLTWDDIVTHKWRIRNYRMQSKVILVSTAVLILVPAVLFFFLEFSDLEMKERILASVFQAMTPRTAGMNTMDLGSMSEAGQVSMMGLMLIGGGPGSTAGGMKVTTFVVLIACAGAVFRKRESAQLFGRRVAHEAISTACTLAFMYVGLCVTGAMLISLVEGLPMLTCMFETASAVATVGLTLGITPGLTVFSKCLLMVLMFIGRVGGLTLIYATLGSPFRPGKLPLENITVG